MSNGADYRIGDHQRLHTILSGYMNYGYGELMDTRQLALYTYENGFEILRAGYIKAHNALICRARAA